MASVSQGSSKAVNVPAGKQLHVSTAGVSVVQHQAGMTGEGYSQTSIVNGEELFAARDHEFNATIEAVDQSANYEVGYPLVYDVALERDSSGAISAIIDPADGSKVQIGGGGGNTVAWSSVTGKPNFDNVATSGQYSDLSGTPNLSQYATTNQLFSGQYADLSGKPAIPSQYSDLSGTVPASDVSGLDNVATSGQYADLSGKPNLNQYLTSESDPTVPGFIKSSSQGSAVADATGSSDVVSQLNALIASLEAANLIAK